MDSAGSVPRSEDPPSPLTVGLLVNLIGTGIAILTLCLPATVIVHYSPQAPVLLPSQSPMIVVRSPQKP